MLRLGRSLVWVEQPINSLSLERLNVDPRYVAALFVAAL
jgi:hypothetical protein